MAGLTDVQVCNRSLIRLGETPVNALTQPGTGVICGTIYPSVKAMCLTLHSWRFNLGKRQLNRLVGAPVNQWRYAYQLPSDLIQGPYAVYTSTDTAAPTTTEWAIYEDKLYANAELIVIDYRIDKPEGAWPPWFATLVELALCAAIGKTVTGETAIIEEYHQRAFGPPSDDMQGGYFSVCKTINAQGNPNFAIASNAIPDARFS